MNQRLARHLKLRLLHALAAFTALTLGAGATHAAQGSDSGALYGEVLVKLASSAALPTLLDQYPLALMGQFGSRPIYRFQVTGTASVKDTLSALALDPNVLLAEPNITHGSPEARKNVVWAIGTAGTYRAQWAPTALRLPDAQKLSTGAGIRVAVLDTGVDTTHPALAGKLLPGYDFVDDDSDPSEEGSETDVAYGHGTHVAGLIALAAPDAKIMPLRVLDMNGEGNTWVLAEAMLHAVDPDGDPTTDDGAHVINLSLGTLTRTRLLEAITEIATCSVDSDPVNDISDPGYDNDDVRCSKTRGALIVAAAGNDGSQSILSYPAAEGSRFLAPVGASTSDQKVAGFSNYGSWVRFMAPGDKITSSIPGGGYGTWSGTSMAAPLYAGVAALVRSANPSMKPDDVIRRIGSRMASLCGSNAKRIDAYAAVKDVNPPNTVCP